MEKEELFENLKVVKRSGKKVDFDAAKIALAIKKGFDNIVVSDEEVEKVINYCIINSDKAVYDEYLTRDKSTIINDIDNSEYDDIIKDIEVVEFAINCGKISTSLIQRRFRLGYNRSSRIIDLLEERGIIGPPNGSKPREVIVKKQ